MTSSAALFLSILKLSRSLSGEAPASYLSWVSSTICCWNISSASEILIRDLLSNTWLYVCSTVCTSTLRASRFCASACLAEYLAASMFIVSMSPLKTTHCPDSTAP